MAKEILPRNKELKQRAQELRNGATPEEKKLWFDFLRNYPVQFNRQRIIGNYIADFYCYHAKLVVELDGAQHFEEDAQAYDMIRTEYMKCCGIEVLRFTNGDIHRNFFEVCKMIDDVVKNRIENSP